MGLKIKEVCKEQGYSLSEVAAALGINPVTLSQSLNGNPTLKRLEDVAKVINVDVSELFVRYSGPDIHGCIYVEGKPILVKSRKDIEEILEKLKQV